MRAVSQRLVAHRTVLSGVHRTVRCGTGPYSREATDRRSLAVALDCPVCTGLSGVHRTVRCAPDRRQRSDPTVDCYRRQRSADVACTGHCTVDVRCTRRQKAAAFCPTASLGCGGYKYHPNWPFSSVGAQATYQDT
jgi:hypothetical protein